MFGIHCFRFLTQALLKSTVKKTGRREGIEPIKRVFPYVFSNTLFIGKEKERKKWLDILERGEITNIVNK